jgi:hypothetical protein
MRPVARRPKHRITLLSGSKIMKRLAFLLSALALAVGTHFYSRHQEAQRAKEDAAAQADARRIIESIIKQQEYLNSLSPKKREIELLKRRSSDLTMPPYPDIEMRDKYGDSPQPATAWREAEMKRYAALFDGTKTDLLIVPFQVQGFGITRSQRSLMSALLSSALSRPGGPDAYLVAKALGDGDRRIDRAAVFRLASTIGAKRILWTYVGHRDGGSLDLYFQFQEAGNDGAFSETSDLPGKRIADLAFDDENPPILVFRKNLGKIVETLGYDFKGTLPLQAKDLNPALPADFASMLQMEDPANSALQLQLLAHLLPDGARREKERLFERSLLLAWRLDPKHPSARQLLARAYCGLFMRLPALAAIRSQQNDAERALAALLNGNLPDLEKHRALVQNASLRLMAEIDIVAVRYAYDKPQGKETDDFKDKLPEILKYFFERRITDSDSNKLHHFNNFQILQFLGEEFPSAGQDITQLLRGKRAAGQRMSSVEIDLILANYLDPRLALPETSSRGLSPSRTLTKLDILEFLTQSGLANLIYAVNRMAHTQGAYNRAIDFINEIGPLFGSLPIILSARAYAEYHGPLRQLSGEAQKNLGQENSKHTALSNYWIDMNHAHLGSDRPEGSLANSTYGTRYLESAFHSSRTVAEKEKLLSETEGRFSGSGVRELLTAELHEFEGKTQAAKDALQSAILEKSTNEDVYVRLGELLIREGNYSAAAKAFAAFPVISADALRAASGGSLKTDWYAYRRGSRFFWLGETELSKPFFKIAAESPTGSEVSLTSAARLALLDDDYPQAISAFFGILRYYRNSNNIREYFSLLHLIGESQTALDGFLVVAGNSTEPHLWDSALVGHRRMRFNDAQIVDWVKQLPFKGKDWPKNRYLWLAATKDRIPGQTLIDAARAASDTAESESHFLEAYRALKEGDYQKAYDLFQKTRFLWSSDHRYMLPYYAIAAAKSGHAQDFDKASTERYERFIKTADAQTKRRLAFDRFLSQSVLAALSGKPEEAEKLFMRAFHDRIPTNWRIISVEYQMAEIACTLFELTGNRKFLEIALRVARANQKTQVWESWSHAFVAVYSDKKAEREVALLRAVYLDPQSFWLSRLPQKERDLALEKAEKSPPFKLAPKSPKKQA